MPSPIQRVAISAVIGEAIQGLARTAATTASRMLRDMGLTPDDARLEAAKPFWRP